MLVASTPMRLGVPKEVAAGERRVALVPETVGRLPDGVEVIVEAGAGEAAWFPDASLPGRRRERRRSVGC